jgi:diaminopimelate decarboxylase
MSGMDDGVIGEVVRCAVVGPLCTTLDTLAHDVPLVDPRPGRLVSIANVGAYGLTASLLGFLSHPAPVEVVVDGAEVVDVSRLRLTRSAPEPPRQLPRPY